MNWSIEVIPPLLSLITWSGCAFILLKMALARLGMGFKDLFNLKPDFVRERQHACWGDFVNALKSGPKELIKFLWQLASESVRDFFYVPEPEVYSDKWLEGEPWLCIKSTSANAPLKSTLEKNGGACRCGHCK